MSWLVTKGVARGRLVAKGYGPSKPLCTALAELNKKPARNKRKIAACRDSNRRVQFTVVEFDGRAVTR